MLHEIDITFHVVTSKFMTIYIYISVIVEVPCIFALKNFICTDLDEYVLFKLVILLKMLAKKKKKNTENKRAIIMRKLSLYPRKKFIYLMGDQCVTTFTTFDAVHVQSMFLFYT